MGLDCIWEAPTKGASIPKFDPPLTLVCGFLTNPESSFRGKVYAEFFRDNFGVDLYEDMDNRKVLEVAHQLEDYVQGFPEDRSDRESAWNVERREVVDLARMFRQFGICGAKLIAWY